MRHRLLLYRYRWSSRCRNLAAAQIIRPILAQMPSRDAPILLDIGCGGLGLAAFLRDTKVAGTDLELSQAIAPGLAFQFADASALPFRTGAFPIVSCVDVLEHLPTADRGRAISEIVRVASRAVLIACPHGAKARDCDAEFRSACEQRGRPVPAWAVEHGRQPYPESGVIAEQVRAAAAALGIRAKVSVSYSEPIAISRLVRAAIARSDLLDTIVSVFFGVLFSILPTPGAETSYRMILRAELSPDPEGPRL
jgi:SAM-dependent methyltransferase